MTMERLKRMVNELVSRGGDVLHVGCEASASLRVHGQLARLGEGPLSGAELEAAITALAGEDALERIKAGAPLDFVCELDGERLRARCFARAGGTALVLRRQARFGAFDDLGLPPALKRIAFLRRGFVLVAGPRRSGKTSTVAAMLHEIDASRTKHIVLLEAPLEIDLPLCRSVLSQREIGRHAPTVATAMRAALRQGAEVIFTSHLPDAESVAVALEAAAAGALVFATVRASGVLRAIEKLIDLTGDRAPVTRRGLADNLSAAISLLQLARADGQGRCVAAEVLVRGPGVASALRDGDLGALYPIMQADETMQTMDDALASLAKRRVITLDEAFDHARDKQRFRRPR
jgi:twitching motility protein PilT